MSNKKSLFSTSYTNNNQESRYFDYLSGLIEVWIPILQYLIKTGEKTQSKDSRNALEINGIAISHDYMNSLWGDKKIDNDQLLKSARTEFYAARQSLIAEFSSEELRSFPIERATRALQLTILEKELLILTIASQIDDRFEKIFAFINDNLNRPYFALSTALKTLNILNDKEISLQSIIECTLIAREHISIGNESQDHATPFIMRPISLNRELFSYLIKAKEVPSDLESIVTYFDNKTLAPLHEQDEEIHSITEYLVNSSSVGQGGTQIDLRGESEVTKWHKATAIIRSINKNCIEIDTVSLLEKENDIRSTLSRILEQVNG